MYSGWGIIKWDNSIFLGDKVHSTISRIRIQEQSILVFKVSDSEYYTFVVNIKEIYFVDEL